MTVRALFGAMAIPPAELRREIFLLGGRHQGDALGGALRELDDCQLSAGRRSLLRAVVSHLAPGRRDHVGQDAMPVPSWRSGLLNTAFYAGLIVAAVLLLL
jgi:hypothetical protein